ncbi:DUF222 domain-containing protein [Candidatus Poriferisocius sp.]|uniref:HNH endonuclease n=1 Tax=Candidatus Poriferisocius sp. TaxID=3101276 RepID=UPI003B020044
MKFDPSVSEPETNSDANTAGSSDAGGGDVLRLELVDLEGMDSKGLFNLMFDILATRHILDGYMTEALNRYGDLVGEGELRALCLQFGMGRYLANREARTAGALRELPATVDAVKSGGFSIDHARLLGESHGRVPLTRAQEDELIDKAKTEDLDRFRKTLARQEDDRRCTDGEPRLDQQRRRRKAAVFNGDDAMVVLHAELDQVTGERVKTALDGMCDRLFRDDSKNGNDRTHQQRAADALAALITQTPGKNPKTTDDTCGGHGDDVAVQPTTLLVKVDYDLLTGQLKNAGLMDDTPISMDELRRIACDAALIPAIFTAEGIPLYLGRKQRSATQKQKLALYARDKHCVNCGLRATACDVHHIKPWEHGGKTNINNLVLLCPTCHTQTHKHNPPPPTRRFKQPIYSNVLLST